MEFYEQLVKAHKSGVDLETNLLKKEIDLIDDAINYIKFNALREAALGKNSFWWFISRHGRSRTYKQADGTDKTFSDKDLVELLNRSEDYLNVAKRRMKKELYTTFKTFLDIEKDDRTENYTITFSWTILETEEL